MTRLLRNTVLLMALLAALVWLAVHLLTWRPAPREAATVACRADSPVLVPGQALKVMTWNIQSLAGKGHALAYTLEGGTSGGDTRPTAQDLAYNLDEVARVIRDEAPDLVLLQDVDDGARATDGQDQLALLQERVVDLYPCTAQTFDWKADFVPLPAVFGSVGRKLATLSKYRITQAVRLQLAQRPGQWPLTAFEPQRAVLSSYLALRDGGQVAVLNTHLDPYQAGDDTQRQQLQKIVRRVDKLESLGTPWIVGGDLNMLPLGQQRRLAPALSERYSPDSDLHLLWDKYPMIPSNTQASGPERSQWLTYFPNDPGLTGPDRTLDYLVHSPRLQRVEARVRQEDTLEISDHLPVIGRFLLPAALEQ